MSIKDPFDFRGLGLSECVMISRTLTELLICLIEHAIITTSLTASHQTQAIRGGATFFGCLREKGRMF